MYILPVFVCQRSISSFYNFFSFSSFPSPFSIFIFVSIFSLDSTFVNVEPLPPFSSPMATRLPSLPITTMTLAHLLYKFAIEYISTELKVVFLGLDTAFLVLSTRHLMPFFGLFLLLLLLLPPHVLIICVLAFSFSGGGRIYPSVTAVPLRVWVCKSMIMCVCVYVGVCLL